MSDLAPPEHSSLTYLGPTGTFTEQALFTQDDLTGLDLRLAPSIPDVFRQVVAGEADLGFAAIEKSIEGSVNATQDTLAFEVYPSEDVPMAVHMLHLVDMGLTQGQNWNLETLAESCADDGIYEFFLAATPEPFVGGVGSPVAPIAVK